VACDGFAPHVNEAHGCLCGMRGYVYRCIGAAIADKAYVCFSCLSVEGRAFDGCTLRTPAVECIIFGYT